MRRVRLPSGIDEFNDVCRVSDSRPEQGRFAGTFCRRECRTGRGVATGGYAERARLIEVAESRCEFLVAQKRSRQPGPAWKPSGIFAGRALNERSGPWSIRARLLQMLSRPSAPSVALGATVGASLIVVETLVVCLLNEATGTIGRFGTLYFLGVLVVSTVWGFGLSATMSVASAVAFAYFRNWPTAHFAPFDPRNATVIAIFLVVALMANTLAGLARVGERFFNLSSDLMCIAGPDHVVRVNRACERALGYSAGELKSRPFLDFVIPEDRDHVRVVLQKSIDSAATVRIENRMIRSDGSQCWIEWSIVPRRGLFYAVGRDVTERRREQDELRQAQLTVEASRDELSALAGRQAALRRVATLVARGASPEEVFAAVSDELARFLDVVNAGLLRYEADGSGYVVAVRYEPGITKMPVTGERIPLSGDDVGARVLRTSARRSG